MTRLEIAGAALTVAIAASLAACNPATTGNAAADAPKADTGKIADAIKADVASGLADLNAHDRSKAGSHDAADAVLMFHGQPNVVGIDAIKADAAKNPADPTLHVTLANESVDVPASGDLAVYHSTFTVSGTDAKTKKPFTAAGNYLVGYKKQADGSWKIEWSVVSDTGPAPATAAAPAAKS